MIQCDTTRTSSTSNRHTSNTLDNCIIKVNSSLSHLMAGWPDVGPTFVQHVVQHTPRIASDRCSR